MLVETGERDIQIDPWRKPEETAKEIQKKNRPVNYKEIVGENRVVLLAESHSNTSIRKHLVSHAKELKEAGITHYAIEADDAGKDVFERLNEGQAVDLSTMKVGPSRRGYENAIRAMSAQGIKVVPIDINQDNKPSKEEREVHLTQNLTATLDQDPSAKVAVLIGGFHATRHHVSEGVPSMGRRLMKLQIPNVIVHFTGGLDRIPRIITDAAQKAGLANKEFVLDMRNYGDSKYIPYGSGESDFVIHLPQL